jgi:hypothetical protein
MSIQDELAELLARIEPPVELKSYVAALIKDAVELCRYNEDRIALENLCDNLFEEGVKLTPEVRDRLQAYCQQFRVDAGRRSLLNALTPGSTGLQSQRY